MEGGLEMERMSARRRAEWRDFKVGMRWGFHDFVDLGDLGGGEEGGDVEGKHDWDFDIVIVFDVRGH
ncbi:hypothetical protein AAC387_Pa07g2267 [Persea americana]